MKNIIAFITACLFGLSSFGQGWMAYPSTSGTYVSGTGHYSVHKANVVPPLGYPFVSGTANPTTAQVQLAIAQSQTLNVLQSSFKTALAQGIAVTSGSVSITLPADDASRNLLAGLATSLNPSFMTAGQVIPSTLVLTNSQGAGVSIPFSTVYALLGSYSAQYQALWTSLQTAKTSVLATTGTAQLSKITLADPTGQ